jgi:hypothetical protein
VQVDGAALVPQAAAVLSAYEAHFSQEYGQQRVQGINLAKVSSQRKQGCGSVFIRSGAGSSNLGWIAIRIRIQIQSGSRVLMSKTFFDKKLQFTVPVPVPVPRPP